MEETEMNDYDRKELARQIKEGSTSGRLDSETEKGGTKYINWELKFNIWTD